MTDDHQPPGQAVAAPAMVSAGAIIATVVGIGQDYLFAHHLTHGWTGTAVACLMIGILTGLPVLLTRPGGAVVPLAAVLAAVSLLAGDVVYDLVSALAGGRTPDPLGIVRGYAHQDLFYLALDLLAPLSAGLVVAARVRRVRAGGHARPDPQDRDPEGGDPEGGDPEGGDPEGGDPQDRDPQDGDAEDVGRS